MAKKVVFKQKKSAKKYTICIVGAGHVGLVAAACFAELGHKVFCADSDPKRIQMIKNKKMPFYEPDMESLVIKNMKEGHLVFTSQLAQGIKKADIIFLAVGTPSLDDGSADMTAIENVAHTIGSNLNGYKLIVEKSTVPVQTGRKVEEAIHRYKKKNIDFDVASNPEFLREGKAVYDFFYPDRIVVGVSSKRAEKILKEIYAPLKAPVIVTDINTAELIKHASNSFLATKISFINAVSRICDLAGADIAKVSLAMGLDKRIGKEFLNSGVGYGGSCFPKDVSAFIYISKKLGYDLNLLKEVKNINQEQRLNFVEKVKDHLWVLKDKKIAILGLSFKPDTDDMRDAPSIDIVELLIKEGASLRLWDPQSQDKAKKIFSKETKKITFAKDPYEAAKDCDCVCFLTEWQELKDIDFSKLKKLMKYPLIADGRNMFDRDSVQKMEFDYIGMGR
jgi:UDPglucose 6-dehydrogenase